jgi:hypothetical protein
VASKAVPVSTSERDRDPVEAHLESLPLERIRGLASELTGRTATTIDEIEGLTMRLLLDEYSIAVAQLRAVTRLTEQRIATATVPMQEMRLHLREQVTRGSQPQERVASADDLDQPYLSLVLASRNDGYAGGMLRRIEVCISAFITQMERFDIPSEVILVDWNPPAGRGLWDALEWPAALRRCTVRVITVPPALHATLPFADRLPILIHRARNVGIRRARGTFILATSPDILLSDELAQWFGRRELDLDCMYRIARRDVPIEALEYDSHAKRLKYCRTHVQQSHGQEGSHRIEGLPHLFTNAAGDFTLLSRDMYFRLCGIPEEREFHSMHFDSVFCFMAHAAGARESKLGKPLRIYHIDHGVPSWRTSKNWLERAITRLPGQKLPKLLLPLARRLAPPKSTLDRRGVPYLDCSTRAGQAQYEQLIRSLVQEPEAFRYNDADWGLGRHTLEERAIGPGTATP